jgi:hypothetical protein
MANLPPELANLDLPDDEMAGLLLAHELLVVTGDAVWEVTPRG